MATQIKFFQPASDETSNTNELHAYREESPQALCGEATLSYNRDAVFDSVPDNAAVHVGCREAIDAENPAPYQPYVDDAETTSEETSTDGATDAATGAADDGTATGAADDGTATGAADDGTATDATSEAVADATDVVPADDGSTDATSTADAAAVETADAAAVADQPQTDQPQ